MGRVPGGSASGWWPSPSGLSGYAWDRALLGGGSPWRCQSGGLCSLVTGLLAALAGRGPGTREQCWAGWGVWGAAGGGAGTTAERRPPSSGGNAVPAARPRRIFLGFGFRPDASALGSSTHPGSPGCGPGHETGQAPAPPRPGPRRLAMAVQLARHSVG